jgi:imidazolonepropionase-like amidohydrolase
MLKIRCWCCFFLLLTGTVAAQTFAPAVKNFISVDAPLIALTHVRVIDGTGAPAREDQVIVIADGKIQAVGPSSSIQPPPNSRVMGLTGYTVIPGLVGMHDHLFYPSGGVPLYNTLGYSAPRLYLAGGVTTIRTTGSIEPYTDLGLKKAIDEGQIPGPKIHVTGPYLEGEGAFTPQMHELTGPDDARKTVAFWAEQGVTSFKVYMNITHSELAAVIEEAHKRGLKVTGHLCSIGFREAAQLGIDGLEHGLVVDTEFVPGKAQDVCPPSQASREALTKLDVASEPVQQTIRELVAHKVAVTSTLPVFETLVPNRPPLRQAVLDAMLPEARVDYLSRRARISESKDSPWPELLDKEMQFEYAFAKAGGLLLAGPDPTGYGGIVPGFGDQREVELLVEAGFTPIEAIRIATADGAQWLGELNRIGTIEVGKQADLVLIKGDPSRNINEVEQVETVFKDGVGYDSAKLIEAACGSVGLH